MHHAPFFFSPANRHRCWLKSGGMVTEEEGQLFACAKFLGLQPLPGPAQILCQMQGRWASLTPRQVGWGAAGL